MTERHEQTMRSRKEIMDKMKTTESILGECRESLICEVLLDIRDILRKKGGLR